MKLLPLLFTALAGTLLRPATAEEGLILAAVKGSADVNVGVAVVQEAYRRSDINLEIRWLEAPEALELSNSGIIDGEVQRIDGIGRMFENLIQIQVPVNYLQGVAFARTDTFQAYRWHSLRPYKIGIVKGILFAEEGTTGMNPTLFSDYDSLVLALNNGAVDVAVMPRISGLLSIQQLGFDHIVQVEGILEQVFLYHYLHKDHAALVPRISEQLKAMLEDLTTQRLRKATYERILNADLDD